MHLNELAGGAIVLAAVANAGFLDLFGKLEKHLFDIGLHGDSFGKGSTKVTDVLAQLSDKTHRVLGKPPVGTLDAWNTVIKDVPDGLEKLYKGILAEAGIHVPHRKQSHCHKRNKYLFHVTDERFPMHSLRITSPNDLGVDDTKQYSGYIDIEDEDKHLFFWFFESRSDPKHDPLVLWLNGGPGCSSMTGLFFELGPSSISPALKPMRNAHSWNNHANVIFLDQPVNTGYSYSNSDVSDTVSASKDVYAFLELFMKQFPEYSSQGFHIAGESYAGHYIPVMGREIVKHVDRSFNLTSLMIGNGLTDPLRQYDMYQPMACGKGGYPSVLSEEECDVMLSQQGRCNRLIEACYNTQSAFLCVPASVYCNNVDMGPYQKTGLNVYDIRKKCEGDSGLCYTGLEDVDNYLNLPEVKESLGAEVDTFNGCNFDVNRNFLLRGDWMKPYYTAVADLVEMEVPILIYAGDKDFICNWLGNEVWTRELPWTGQEHFNRTKLSPFVLKKNNKEAGMKRNYKHFTFLRVYDAGHMVPFDQPHAALEMYERWIQGQLDLEL